MNRKVPPRKASLVIFAGFFVVLLVLSIKAYANRIAIGYTDSAGFMELISKSGLIKPLQSNYFSSSTRLFSLYGENSEKICGLIPESYEGTRSVFQGHPYLISTFGAVSSHLTNLGPDVVSASMLLTSSFMGISAIYVFLIKNRVSAIASTLFIFTISCYPVLTQSLLGQPYFDRLILGPATTAFLLIWWTKHKSIRPWKWICVLTIFLSLISERGAAVAGLISIGYLLALHGKEVFKRKELRYILFTGVLSLTYVFIWSLFWQNLSSYGQISPLAWMSRLEMLFSDPYFNATQLFFGVSASFIFLTLFADRAFIFVVISIAPNLLIGVGGAELNGFVSHYHQIYLPILLAASTIGVVKISKSIRAITPNKYQRPVEIAPMLIFTFIAIIIGFSNAVPIYGKSTVNDAQALWLPFTTDYNSNSNKIRLRQSEIADYVAETKLMPVSAPESLYPPLFLSGVNLVEYWPFGVGSARVVIAPYADGVPNVLPYADPQGSTDELRLCVQSELDENYELKRIFPGDIRVFVKK